MSTRLPQLTDDQAAARCPPDLLAAIRQRRGGDLLELDRLLLHSTPLAEGWNALMGRVRNAFGLSPLWRELAMCGVAALNGADYEMHHHLPLYRQAGATEAQAAALLRLGAGPQPGRSGPGRAEADAVVADPAFDADQRAVLRLTLEMTRDLQVADATFAAARAAVGSDERMVELVAVIASYNMVSRILVALNLRP